MPRKSAKTGKGAKAKGAKAAAAKPATQRKAPRTPKTKPTAPGAPPSTARGIGDNSRNASRLTPAEEQKLFLQHRTSWNHWQAKLKVVEKIGIDVKAALKADGFKLAQFKIADQLTTVKGEAKVVGEVSDRLKVARWIGHAMGAQMDLFERKNEADVPVRVRAYEQGRQASIENRAAKPQDHNYAPATPGYEGYMNGFHDHQEEISAAGFKAKSESTPASTPTPAPSNQNDLPTAPKEEPEQLFEVPGTGERVSRPEFHRRLREQAQEVDAAADKVH